MSKSDSLQTSKMQKSREKISRHGANPSAMTRIDAPHVVNDLLSGSEQTLSAESVPDATVSEQLRCQADQLSARLHARQKELDHREAELNCRIARLESDARTARLWFGQRESELASDNEDLVERQRELAAKSESLAKREREFSRQQQEMLERRQELSQREQKLSVRERDAERRLTRLAAAEAARRNRASTSNSDKSDELRRAAEALKIRQRQFDDAEVRLAESQAETQKLHEQLVAERRGFAKEAAELQERTTAEHRQAMADLEEKRQTVQRRADHVDQCQAALKQLRVELGRMHRETLEIRLATEELWAQLSGAAPPATLTQSLGRIQTKLAEEYRQANTELAEQKKEIETIRDQLAGQHENLVKHKRQFEQWATVRQEECQQQASRLVARERQVHQEEIRHREQSRQWKAERLKYQRELRRLQAKLSTREESAVFA